MITWSIVRQWLGKHVFAATDTQATIKHIVGKGIFYKVHLSQLQTTGAMS
jgi:hypothetical protein